MPDRRPVAAAYAQQLALQQVYVADLDAIGGAEPDWNVLCAESQQQDLQLWIDAGTATPGRAAARWRLGRRRTTGSSDCGARSAFVAQLAARDLAGGRAAAHGWSVSTCSTAAPGLEWRVARPRAASSGSRPVESGRAADDPAGRRGWAPARAPGRWSCCAKCATLDAQLQLICGGGIRSLEQIDELGQAGCDGVLLGSALHSGLIGAPALRRVEQT